MVRSYEEENKRGVDAQLKIEDFRFMVRMIKFMG